jgi:hypothetical protein
MTDTIGPRYRDRLGHITAVVRSVSGWFYIKRLTFGWDCASRAYDTTAAAIAELDRRAKRNGWEKVEEKGEANG